MSIENAHFIIEAVNNHDRLTREVAELRGLLAEVQTAMHDYVEAANHVGLNEYDGIYLGHAQDVEAKCRKALAKVTP